jgi:hypothetical protein
MAALKTELKSDIAELRTELKSDIAELRAELKVTTGTLSAHVDTRFANLQTEIQQSQNRILLTIITVAFAMIGVLKYLP